MCIHLELQTTKKKNSSLLSLTSLFHNSFKDFEKRNVMFFFIKTKTINSYAYQISLKIFLFPGQVYTSIIGGCACNYAAMPLFFEVAVDMAFPVPDVLVTGVMTASDCIVSTLFLTVYSFPNVGKQTYICLVSMLGIFFSHQKLFQCQHQNTEIKRHLQTGNINCQMFHQRTDTYRRVSSSVGISFQENMKLHCLGKMLFGSIHKVIIFFLYTSLKELPYYMCIKHHVLCTTYYKMHFKN